MNLKMLGFLIVASLLGQSAGAVTLSLDYYRDAMGSTEAQRKVAAERIATLRKLLGTQKLVFEAATDANGPFRKFDAGTDAGNKESVSLLYKTILDKEISAFREKERRGLPPSFDPSNTPVQARAAIDKLRKEFCDENLSGRFFEVANQVSQLTARKQIQVAAALAPRAAALNEERRKLIATYLEGLKLPATIGDLVEVTFIDGTVSHLWFAKKETPALKVPVSLSSLINYRTNFDKYFLIMQSCFVSYLDERIDEKREGKESKTLLLVVSPIAKALYEGSLGVYNQYTQLTKVQLNSLIDLFLQLRANDIPTDEEMVADGNIEKWDPKKNPSVLNYLEAGLAKEPGKEVYSTDYRYYRLLHRQLYELEDYLTEEKTPRTKKDPKK